MKNVMLKLIDFLGKYGLEKLQCALLLGAGLALVLGFATGSITMTKDWLTFLFRWFHVLAAIMWIGLLWYFNFVQIPSMPNIPDEQKPAISKVIAPTALFWFRWSSLGTVVTGLILAHLSGYLMQALLLGYFKGGKETYIGLGMWLGLIMAFNVWNVIWPAQQKALGLVPAEDEEKKASAQIAKLTSRFNTALSIPMLYFMVAAQNLS